MRITGLFSIETAIADNPAGFEPQPESFCQIRRKVACRQVPKTRDFSARPGIGLESEEAPEQNLNVAFFF
jgi:hypothetical protein